MDPRNKPIERTLRISNPSAGNDFSITPDTAAGWLFQTLRFTFTTGAAIATREITITVSDSDGEYVRLGSNQGQTDSQAREYGAAQGTNGVVATLPIRSIEWPTLGVWVPAGHTFASLINNIQAADTITTIRAHIIEFPTGPAFFYWPFPHFITEESS